MKRKIMLVIGWIAACLVLLAALMQIYFLQNLFDWHPQWDWRIPISALGALASIVAIWFLARATRDRFSVIASLVLCMALMGFAFPILPAEPIEMSKGGAFLAGLFTRQSPSPLWFRGGMFAFMALPGVFWLVWLLRNRRVAA